MSQPGQAPTASLSAPTMAKLIPRRRGWGGGKAVIKLDPAAASRQRALQPAAAYPRLSREPEAANGPKTCSSVAGTPTKEAPVSCSSEKHVKRTQQRQTKGGRGKSVPRPTAAAPVSIRINTARSGADISRFLSPPSTPAERNTQRVGTKPSGGRSAARARSAPRSPGQELWPGRRRREERCGGSEARPPSLSRPHAGKRRERGHAALTHGRLTARLSLASPAARPRRAGRTRRSRTKPGLPALSVVLRAGEPQPPGWAPRVPRSCRQPVLR